MAPTSHHPSSPRGRLAALVLSVALAQAAPAAAQPVTLGGELLANTYYTAAQQRPTVAAAADGSFVVVWESLAQDGDNYGVFGQRFDSAGEAAGTEFLVNTYTPLRQGAASVDTDTKGGFVVVWESDGQDGNYFGIFGQRFGSDGLPAGTEFQLNNNFIGAQRDPTVATFSDGGFVAAWQSDGQDGQGAGVFARRFLSTGLPADLEFAVNTFTTAGQYLPRLDVGADDGFVVVWASDDGRDGDGYGVFGQRFDSAGATVGTEFAVNTFTTGAQRVPDVATIDDGFVVVWQSYAVDMYGEGIAARRYDGDGEPLAAEFVVNTYAIDNQRYPRVDADSLAGFVVAWETDGLDGELEGIILQQFDSLGGTTGPESVVNTKVTGSQRRPAISAAGGEFVVAWEGTGEQESSYDAFGQRYFDVAPTCGDAIPLPPGLVTAVDALAVLQTSIAIRECLLCVCDVDDSGVIVATDALQVMRFAVSQPVVLTCPQFC